MALAAFRWPISSPVDVTLPRGTTPAATTTPYPVYKDYKDYKDAGSYPGMTSSIASLRLKAKQHQSGFTSYSPQPPPLSPRSSSLSACQYTGALPDRPVL